MIRVLVDTNVVISALLFPKSTPAQALYVVLDEHRLVLTGHIIDELREVVTRKRPDLLPALDDLLAALDFELHLPTDRATFDAPWPRYVLSFGTPLAPTRRQEGVLRARSNIANMRVQASSAAVST